MTTHCMKIYMYIDSGCLTSIIKYRGRVQKTWGIEYIELWILTFALKNLTLGRSL